MLGMLLVVAVTTVGAAGVDDDEDDGMAVPIRLPHAATYL